MKALVRIKKIILIICIFILTATVSPISSVYSQSEAVNQTMKEVLDEAKKNASTNRYKNIGPIIMIVGVIGLVGFAVYISFFKEDDDEVASKSKIRKFKSKTSTK